MRHVLSSTFLVGHGGSIHQFLQLVSSGLVRINLLTRHKSLLDFDGVKAAVDMLLIEHTFLLIEKQRMYLRFTELLVLGCEGVVGNETLFLRCQILGRRIHRLASLGTHASKVHDPERTSLLHMVIFMSKIIFDLIELLVFLSERYDLTFGDFARVLAEIKCLTHSYEVSSDETIPKS